MIILSSRLQAANAIADVRREAETSGRSDRRMDEVMHSKEVKTLFNHDEVGSMMPLSRQCVIEISLYCEWVWTYRLRVSNSVALFIAGLDNFFSILNLGGRISRS